MCKGLPEAVTTSRLQAVSAACDVQSGSPVCDSSALATGLQSCAPISEKGCRHCAVLSAVEHIMKSKEAGE